MNEVRVRFAPSPTGPLHLGGVRTALYNYLFAKKNGGDFILRIEDTDTTRYVEGAEDYIMKAMEWLGISPVESPKVGGDFSPYRQSERREIYDRYTEQILKTDYAYLAFDTPEELDAIRTEHEARGEVFSYNNVSRKNLKNSLTLSEKEVQELLDKNTPYSYAIHNPIASDGLHNPHCHLMIYEKNFNRSFFKEDFTKEIDKNYFKGTFKKDENYIKKNLNYEKKSFIYDSREKFEEQLLIMSKSKTKDEIISSSEKSKEKDDYDKTKENKISSKDYEQLIKTEQVLMENVRGEYMENFKKVLKDDDSLNSLKNMLEKLDEKDLEKFVVMFSKESKFFEDVKNLSIDELKAKNYTNETVKNILTEIVDINTLQSDETLINKDSDLLKIDKSIREQTNARDITDKYIFDQVVSELFKGDNESSEESENETNVNVFKLNVPRYNELNYFLENLKNDFPFKIADYITETKVNISGDENENSTLEVKCKQLNKEKHEIDCISYEKKFNKKEEDFFSNDILRNQLRLFYYEFLNYFDENIVGKDETPGYTEFYENLENNLSNEYMELTKSFVYTNLFYNIDTNYFATKDDENENKKNNSKSIDFDFLNPYSNKENLHNKVFMPNLSKQINENVLNMLDNE